MSDFFEKTKRGRGKAKHAVLDQYLKAYFAIQCQCKTWKTPVLYIDGFAGPGTYKSADENSNEEEGSPIVAYQAATEHSLIEKFSQRGNTILLIFVEKNAGHASRLSETIEQLHRTKTDLVKKTVKFVVWNIDFVSFLEGVLQNLELIRSPMFVFADPFGYGGKSIPMSLFKRLLERQDGEWLPTEVFITVMDGFASRFISDARKSSSLNALMGADNWHHLTEQGDLTPQERRKNFIDLYIGNLKHGIRNALTLKFGMKDDRNRHIYHLIYLTCHIRGIESMKRSMWKRTQTSTEMVFSEWTENRNEEGENIVDKSPDQVAKCLFELITSKFSGRDVYGFHLDKFIWLYTPYISNVKVQLKKLFKSFAINNEKAFEKIFYRFPGSQRSLDDVPDIIL